MKDISPAIYNNALKEIQKCNNKISEFSEKCETEKKDTENKYWDLIWELKQKIRNLERERDKKKENIENKKTTCESNLLKQYHSSQEIVDYTEKLFDMMDISDNEFKETIPEEPVDVIADDNYKKMYVVIGHSKKPVNCFSLILYVKKIFREKMISTITWPWEIILKEAPSEKILLEWYQKNKSNLKWKRRKKTIYLSDVLSEFSKLERMYEQAKELYKQKQWRLAYLYHEKYYYEKYVTSGSDLKEYKAVLERIKILKTKIRDLPLLIADIKTDKGKKEFSEKLNYMK